MSWTGVRPYFKTQLESRGYELWPDGFNFENIPSNIMDRSYHVDISPITGDRQNQSDQESTLDVSVRTFYKGYRDPQEAKDKAIEESEEIMKLCVKPSNRAATEGILNVVFNEVTIDALDESNDNAVVATASYSVRVITAV